MNERFDAVCAGHICLDLHPAFVHADPRPIQELLRPGTLVRTGALTATCGGVVANVGRALRGFGLRVAFMAQVGNDLVGRTIVELMRREGNADGIRVVPDRASSYTVVLSPPGVDRIFLHDPGANDHFSADAMDFELVARSRLFHFGYPTLMRSLYEDGGARLADIFSRAKAGGAITSLDISLPDPATDAGRADWRGLFARVAPHVDCFTPSLEEAFFCLEPAAYLEAKRRGGGAELIDLVPPQEYRRIGGAYLAMGFRVMALKAGHRGWYVRTAPRERFASARLDPGADWFDRELWAPAHRVERVASAVAAGDRSIAAFLTAILKRRTLADAVRAANAAGAAGLSGPGTAEAGWDELGAIAARLPLRELPELAAAGFGWDAAEKIWTREPDRR